MRPILFVLASAIVGVAPASAQPHDGPATAIRAYIAKCHAAYVCNGAYLVARNGKPV